MLSCSQLYLFHILLSFSQAYCNIITGAAMCLGLRYAGTEDPEAFDNLKHILDLFLNMSGQYIGEYAGKATVESCMVLVLLSLSLVKCLLFSLNFNKISCELLGLCWHR